MAFVAAGGMLPSTFLNMPITVAIVEDNDKLRGTLARLLDRAAGFRCVSQYPSAEDALKGLPQVRPDVVLMDINLPGMNGVETVQSIFKGLEAKKQERIPVIFITGYADEKMKQDAKALNPVAYIYKPFDVPELVDKIKKAVE